MSAEPEALTLVEQRNRLEQRANAIRSRLVRTVEALDKRRREAQALGHQAKRLAMPVGAALVGMVLLTAGTVLVVRSLVHSRRERRLGYRISRALEPLRAPRQPSFWSEAIRRVSLAALAVVATELTKRGARVALAPRASRALESGGPPADSG